MVIEWNKVTWYSKIMAVILFIAVFYVGFYFGNQFGDINSKENKTSRTISGEKLDILPREWYIANDVIFECPNNQNIHAIFYKNRTVDLDLPDGRSMTLPQAISASGARYANSDESFVFWNKGDTAFIQEQGKTTLDGCIVSSSGK